MGVERVTRARSGAALAGRAPLRAGTTFHSGSLRGAQHPNSQASLWRRGGKAPVAVKPRRAARARSFMDDEEEKRLQQMMRDAERADQTNAEDETFGKSEHERAFDGVPATPLPPSTFCSGLTCPPLPPALRCSQATFGE